MPPWALPAGCAHTSWPCPQGPSVGRGQGEYWVRPRDCKAALITFLLTSASKRSQGLDRPQPRIPAWEEASLCLKRTWSHASQVTWSGLISAVASHRHSSYSQDRTRAHTDLAVTPAHTRTLTRVPGLGAAHLYTFTCVCTGIPTVPLTQVHTAHPHLSRRTCESIVHM